MSTLSNPRNSKGLVLGAIALLGGIALAADEPTTATTPTFQVYHECTEDVYCKSFALTGKSSPWELVPNGVVKSYDYPTEQYNATVWCSKTPTEDAYSWVKLSLDDGTSGSDAEAVSYTVGTYGADGDKTEPPFLKGETTVGPVDTAASGDGRCNTIDCKSGDASCASGTSDGSTASCGADKTIRWSFCLGSQQSNLTSPATKLKALRVARFVA